MMKMKNGTHFGCGASRVDTRTDRLVKAGHILTPA